MKSTAILEVMVRDHAQLLSLLNEVQRSLHQNPDKVLESFNQFTWNLEKHFFTEERAIFTSYNPEEIDEGYELFLDVSKQHTQILQTVQTLRQQVKNKELITVEDLKSQLVDHKNFEENHIYPMLDQQIDDGEKRFILNRINEIPLQGGSK